MEANNTNNVEKSPPQLALSVSHTEAIRDPSPDDSHKYSLGHGSQQCFKNRRARGY